MTDPPDDNLWQQGVRDLLLHGQKIEAIKLVRQQTGAGLKDAKDFVDAMGRGENPPMPAPAEVTHQSVGCSMVILIVVIALGFLMYFGIHPRSR